MFARNAEGDHRDSPSHHYVKNAEIEDFNVLINGKSFFDLPVKKKKLTRKLLMSIETMTTQLVIYWILLIWKNMTD